MYDKVLVLEILSQIRNSINITQERFKVVHSVDYLTATP